MSINLLIHALSGLTVVGFLQSSSVNLHCE